MKTFTTIATCYNNTAKTCTIKKAYCDATKKVTKAIVRVDGDDHDTYLTLPTASTARLAYMTNGRKASYIANSEAITEDEEGNRYYLDRAPIISLI